uniref:Uncharacterized protein n=1 Tax=Cacopsylla melanoneura TaxID=428564 RepID=A0A8D8VCS2_9HEMI
MLIRMDSMWKEGLGGIVMVCLWSLKLTRSWASKDPMMLPRWALPSITLSVERLSCGTRLSGRKLSKELADGLILIMTTRRCIRGTWKASGGCSQSCGTRDWSTGESK